VWLQVKLRLVSRNGVVVTPGAPRTDIAVHLPSMTSPPTRDAPTDIETGRRVVGDLPGDHSDPEVRAPVVLRIHEDIRRTSVRGAFSDPIVEVKTHGNVLASTDFLCGLAAGELRRGELESHDPEYQMVITVRVVKRGK